VKQHGLIWAIVEIADIAGIARHRRDRGRQTLPLINADDTDQKNPKTFNDKGHEGTRRRLPRIVGGT
jgi:hypothetical protein